MVRHFLLVAVALGAAFVQGCGVTDDEEVADTSSDVVGGTESLSRPAIGRVYTSVAPCTATLVSSRVILTAAHCFDHKAKSGLATGNKRPSFDADAKAKFRIERSDGTTHEVAVRRWDVLLGVKPSPSQTHLILKDIAVAELEADVPNTIAVPLKVATAYPSVGAPVTLWGYGCTSRTWQPPVVTQGSGVGKKRVLSTDWRGHWVHKGTDLKAPGFCDGDSGGPMLDSDGRIVGIVASSLAYSDGKNLEHYVEIYADPIADEAQRFIDQRTAFYGRRQPCRTCDRVALRTKKGYYVQAFNGGGDEVNAEGKSPGDWETFSLLPLGGDYFALQAYTLQFVQVIDGGGSKIRAVGNWPREFETLRLVNGEALQTWNGNYISAVFNGGDRLSAEMTSIGTWEKFKLEYQ